MVGIVEGAGPRERSSLNTTEEEVRGRRDDPVIDEASNSDFHKIGDAKSLDHLTSATPITINAVTSTVKSTSHYLHSLTNALLIAVDQETHS